MAGQVRESVVRRYMVSQMIEQRRGRVRAISTGLLGIAGLFFLAWALWGIHRHSVEGWFYGMLGAVNLAVALGLARSSRHGLRSVPPECGIPSTVGTDWPRD